MTYEPAAGSKSDLYRDLLRIITSGKVSLPDDARFLAITSIPGRAEVH